jgi:uncharacterized protein
MRIFTPTAADRHLYETELRGFLPEDIIDIHAHLAVPGTMAQPSPERLSRYWVLHVPMEQTPEEFLEAYDLLLPGKRVFSTVFALPLMESDIAAQNKSVLEASRRYPSQINPFLVVTPCVTEDEIDRAFAQGFAGLKPYPDFVISDHPGEERIREFLTPAMCAVADRRKLPVILHIAKSKRFADLENLRDLLDMAQRYPGMRLIIAHFGRSYTPWFLEKALEFLGDNHPWWYDFSAVTNPEVFHMALEQIPHERICFGFDNPIMLSRGFYDFPAADRYRVHIHGYNLVSPDHPPLAYQILLGFKQAATRLGISRSSLQKIFHDNACSVLKIPGVNTGFPSGGRENFETKAVHT